ncbi:putative Exosome complex component RRP40 [Hypsibius exemplaris]|uniref:Exosome complex component RRP40 n=1 Tax=Hypsibius exemplaris TaxID=2072580 RepID=A0A1W0XDC5_HYPEX|nr:putative Exosome complex component RRP40 [Hypsibius exemplaris]
MDVMDTTDADEVPKRRTQQICIPGDVAFNLTNQSMKTVSLGPGVRKVQSDIMATRVGVMQYRPPATFFLSTTGDSYSPATGDDVIGVVVKRKGHEVSEQTYVVDLGRNTGRQTGILPILAFKGATKRYRPNLKKGDLIYGRIRRTTPDGPVRLTCTSNTNQSFWGPLRRTGALYRASLPFARRCLTDGSPEHDMIQQVGVRVPFETAIGVNGRIWLYTGMEKSQNLLYSLFRDAEAAKGDGDVIRKATVRVVQEIASMSDDIPLEDNTQYWVTRVV